MKEKIRKTGEIVDIISCFCQTYRSDMDVVSYIDSKGSQCIDVRMNRFLDFEDVEEYDEHSLVDSFIEMKTWENIPDDVLKNCDDMCKVYSLSNFQCKSRKWLIKYLSALPTVRCDSKINKILKITTD